MVTHPQATHVSRSHDVHSHDFEYYSAPHAGLNWPFAQEMILSLAVWSSVAASAVFWACLLGGAVH